MSQDELNSCIEALQKNQRIFLTLQLVLVVLSVILGEKPGTILMFIQAPIIIIFGWFFSAKASTLARKKYPNVIAHTTIVGKGAGWDPFIEDEAMKQGDNTTVQILKFNRRCVCLFLVGMVGFLLARIIPAMVQLYIELKGR